jgi:nucleoside-diphosphate-sugar epimerase
MPGTISVAAGYVEKVLVTGGLGFVGRMPIPVLRSAGYEVWALGRSEETERSMRALGAATVRKAGKAGDGPR